jgi:hypothetical protein
LCGAIREIGAAAGATREVLQTCNAQGRKSYWGYFHGDVTVTQRPSFNPAKSGTSG